MAPESVLKGKWVKLDQKGKCPGPRSSHAIAVVGNKMYSFGGEFSPNVPIDRNLHVFDLKTNTWSIAPATGDIPELPSLGVGMVAIGTTLYTFGGRDAPRNYNGFYSYDTLKNEWKLLTPVGEGPKARSFHSMTADDENVYLFGGVHKRDRLDTLESYNVVEGKWVTHPTPGESFIPRGAPGLAVVNKKIWVIFGFCGYALDDMYCYDLVKGEWSQVETKGEKLAGRSVFALGTIGKHVVIFGGELVPSPETHMGAGEFSDEVFALDTETLEWEKVNDGREDGLREEERPGPRGWGGSSTATINGEKGVLTYAGNTHGNIRIDDLFFLAINPSA